MSTRLNPFGRFLACMVPNWLARRPEISHGAKLCYGRLIQFNGRGNRCNPRERVLAGELGVSERTCRRFLHELRRWGLLEIQQNGLRRANSYFFLEHPWMSHLRSDKTDRQNRPEMSASERPSASAPSGRESKEGESTKKNPCSPLAGDEVCSQVDNAFLSQSEEIYALYPKPAGKPAALRAIRHSIQEFGFEHVRDRTKAYAECVGGGELRFVPLATRFFREQRFNDAPETWKRVSRTPATVQVNTPDQYSGGTVIF